MKELLVSIDTISIQVRDYQGEGSPLLMLHFGGSNLIAWQNAAPFFQKKYRVILPDLRGHGKSDKPDVGNNIDRMALDVIQVMDHLKIHCTHIVGSSLGAEVGLSLAANYPERVASLVCEGAFHSEFGQYSLWQGSETEFEAHVADVLLKLRCTPEPVFPSIEALVAESRRVFESYGWWNESVEAMERYDAFKLAGGRYTPGWRKHSKLDYMESYFKYRFEDYYRRVVCPVLMVPGEQEMKNERFRKIITDLAALCASGEIVEVEGWIHPYGWLVGCKCMCREIVKFLDRYNP